jgi:galactokinase
MLQAARRDLDPLTYRRAHHVITEIERTLQAAEAIRSANWLAAGMLMYASHASLRDDFEVSCPELDLVVEVAQSIGEKGGVFGCRMTGGGFGGCTVSLVQAASIRGITAKVAEVYRARTGIEPTMFVSRPAAGAKSLK